MDTKSKLLLDKRLQSLRDDEKKSYFQLTIIIVLLTVFLIFAIRPSLKISLELREKIKEYKQLNEQLNEKISYLRQVREIFNEHGAEIILLDYAITELSEEGNLLRSLNYAATKNRVNIDNVNFTYNEDETLGTLGFSMTIEGNYQQALIFIGEIINMRRVVSISSLDIQPDFKNNSINKVIISLKGKAYYEKN